MTTHLAWDYVTDLGSTNGYYHVTILSERAGAAFNFGEIGTLFTLRVPDTPPMADAVHTFVTAINEGLE